MYTRAVTARPASRGGPAPRSTSCSAPTRSCERSPRCTVQRRAPAKFVSDFVAAFGKVMDLDRFDLASSEELRPVLRSEAESRTGGLCLHAGALDSPARALCRGCGHDRRRSPTRARAGVANVLGDEAPARLTSGLRRCAGTSCRSRSRRCRRAAAGARRRRSVGPRHDVDRAAVADSRSAHDTYRSGPRAMAMIERRRDRVSAVQHDIFG